MLGKLLLCAVLSAALLWALAAALVYPLQRGALTPVLWDRGSGPRLEAGCRAWRLLRRMGLAECDAVLVTDDLDPAGLALAQALARADDGVRLCRAQSLFQILQNGE